MTPENERVNRREEATGFDLWLKRALRERYGGIAREPIPQSLLELLDDHGQDRFVGDD